MWTYHSRGRKAGPRLRVFMPKITAIQPQKKNPRRVNIYLDGEFAFGLSRIVAAWLRVGQHLSAEKIAQLREEDQREKAYQQALRFLSYRPRSQAEIRRNLRKHDIPESIIEDIIQRLEEIGLANDEEFARAWIENRNTFRPRSRRALTSELRQKGVPEDIIRSVLDENTDDEHLAYQAGLRKARKLAHLEWPDFRRKLGDFLARRGFNYSVIAPLLRQLWQEVHPESDPTTEDIV
ncbi:MAG: regulatory protein RecX [Anaerolineae bacterium]|nr:MAG: regulatory protein RecX [Anaerolineae bacterium]